MEDGSGTVRRGVRLLPSTSLGQRALGLLAIFFVLAYTRFGLHLGHGREGGGGSFFHNPWLAAQAIGAGVAATFSGVMAAFAVGFRSERSILAFVSILIGFFVLAFWISEIVGKH